ncbi:MAG: hypothetical protein JJE36_03130 [Coriobacteriia bacterium]|nr:hypothetical protein [Coriobacteriia bacterium]
MKYSFTPETPEDECAENALRRIKIRRELVEALGCDSRVLRQYATTVLLTVAEAKPELLVEFQDELLDALNRPEPMTRYQILRIISALISQDAHIVEKGYEDIEACLYDEESPNVRGSAFRLLAHYGATTQKRSERVWPSLSDALRCWHRDTVFMEMLADLITLLEGKCSDRVRDEAATLFEFDIESTDNLLRRKARYIVSLRPEADKK